MAAAPRASVDEHALLEVDDPVRACSAAFGSCVTMMIVLPSSSFSRSSRPRISSAVVRSRSPVGSSATMSVGSVISARAIATRCCWPPDSSFG